MEIKSRRALPSSDMSSFSTRDDDRLQNYHNVATYNGYDGTEQFSRSNLFSLNGMLACVIPEENEDLTGSVLKTTTLDSTPTEGSPITEDLTKTVRVISEEVKKLGLTAQVNFEPYWVETQSNDRSRHRPSDCIEPPGIEVVPKISGSGISTYKSEPLCVESTCRGRCLSGGIVDPIGIVDFQTKPSFKKQINLKPCPTLVDSISKTNNSDIEGKRSRHVSNESSDDNTVNRTCTPNNDDVCINDVFQEIAIVESTIFKRGEGLKRSSSAGCLRKIQDGIRLFKDMPENEESCISEKERATSGQDITHKNSMRRNYSTSAIQKLENSELLNSNMNNDSNIQRSKISTVQHSEKTLKEMSHSDGSELGQNVRGRSKSFGSTSVKWVKIRKVRQTRRERNMYSPTSF